MVITSKQPSRFTAKFRILRGTFDRSCVLKQVAAHDPLHQSQPQPRDTWRRVPEDSVKKMEKDGKITSVKDMLVLLWTIMSSVISVFFASLKNANPDVWTNPHALTWL